MARYRCFCMTEGGRVITGTLVEADHVARALDIASGKWRGTPGFASVEIWLGSDRVYPASVQSLHGMEIAAPVGSGSLPSRTGHALGVPASAPSWILQHQVLAGGGQFPSAGAAVIAARKPD